MAAVPGETEVMAVDAARMREQLGLPAGAGGPGPLEARPNRATLALRTALTSTLPWLTLVAPDEQVVEPGRVLQAAIGGVDTSKRVTAVRVAGDPRQVMDALEKNGWRRSGDRATRADGDQRAARVRGDVVVFARTEAALAQAPRGGRARQLIRSVDGPIRGAAVFKRGAACIDAYATGEDVKPARGTLVVEVDGRVAVDRLGRRGTVAGVTVAAARAKGRRVSTTFEGKRVQPLVGYRLLLQNLRFDALYRCPGA